MEVAFHNFRDLANLFGDCHVLYPRLAEISSCEGNANQGS